MKRLAFMAVGTLLCCSACTPSGSLLDGRPLSLRMVESEMARHPSPTMLDGIPAGQVKWNYTSGLELLSFLDAAAVYGRDDFRAYVDRYYDTIVRPDATVLTYRKEKYNLDHICPGRPLFELYARTGESRYRQVLDTLFSQLQGQPRNDDGGFWHKKVYPHQMWLDGLYMAEPFYAQYAKAMREAGTFSEAEYDNCVRDIAEQFVTVGAHTYDPATELYRHAYDDSREMFWCDPETGQSQHAWGRAMGWYAMALVETLQYLPQEHDGAAAMRAILNHICEVLPRYADPETGMWYQVLDAPEREGNYQEATGSIMFVYAMLKGVRLGYLPAELGGEAVKAYEQFVDRFVRENPDGTISITDCCAVAGLGGKNNRSGTFEYYISEPIIENDCKGVGPFVWASLEYEALKRRG